MATKKLRQGRLSRDRRHRHEQDLVGGRRQDAVETASKSLRDLRVAEVTQMDLKVEDGKVVAYRARCRCRSSTRVDDSLPH